MFCLRAPATALLLLIGGVAAAAAACVANPQHPYDAAYDSGDPGWVDLGPCKACGANDTCTSCWAHWTLASNGTCVECTDPFCEACRADSPDVCRDCTFDWEGELEVGNYADSQGRCTPCPQPGCMRCRNIDGTCQDCRAGEGLVGGACEMCSDASCLTCDGDASKCTLCTSGFFADGDGKCSPCADGCESCTNAETCTACSTGMGGASGEDGLWLDPRSGACVPCSDGCTACPQGPDTCQGCATSYTNTTDGSACVRCTDPHCTTCAPGDPDRCLICADFSEEGRLQWGADPETGACVDCKVEHCASCQDNAQQCDWCDDGWWNDKAAGACTPCSGEHCVVCATDGDSGLEVCTDCEEGFEVDYDSPSQSCVPATARR